MKTTMKWVGVILGVLMVILGLYGSFYPARFFATLGWLIGLTVMFAGLDGFGTWMAVRKAKSASGWDLFLAIISVLFGFMLLCNMGMRILTDEVLLVLFGVWIALYGVMRVIGAIRNKPKLWGLLVVLGVALIILAIASFAHPFITAISIGLCVAVNFMFQGANLILGALMDNKQP